MEVKRTERGWAGHLYLSSSCRYHRNTLLEYGDKKWIISTVGAYFPFPDKEPENIEYKRFYETMAFEAQLDEGYYEANVSKRIYFNSKWDIDHIDYETDKEADEMHEAVVTELIQKIKEK